MRAAKVLNCSCVSGCLRVLCFVRTGACFLDSGIWKAKLTESSGWVVLHKVANCSAESTVLFCLGTRPSPTNSLLGTGGLPVEDGSSSSQSDEGGVDMLAALPEAEPAWLPVEGASSSSQSDEGGEDVLAALRGAEPAWQGQLADWLQKIFEQAASSAEDNPAQEASRDSSPSTWTSFCLATIRLKSTANPHSPRHGP